MVFAKGQVVKISGRRPWVLSSWRNLANALGQLLLPVKWSISSVKLVVLVVVVRFCLDAGTSPVENMFTRHGSSVYKTDVSHGHTSAHGVPRCIAVSLRSRGSVNHRRAEASFQKTVLSASAISRHSSPRGGAVFPFFTSRSYKIQRGQPNVQAHTQTPNPLLSSRHSRALPSCKDRWLRAASR